MATTPRVSLSRIMRLYAAAAGTPAASINSHISGHIKSVTLQVLASGGGSVSAELSLMNGSQIATNDATGTLATVMVGSGANQTVKIDNLNIPIKVMDFVYLHITGTAPTAVYGMVVVN